MVELLAFDSDPGSRAALVTRVEQESNWAVATRAAEALRRWEPADSLEADYVLLGAKLGGLGGEVVERLRARGDAKRILDALPRVQPANEAAYLRPLATALFAREPLPVEAAAGLLDSRHERVAAVAAQILGRAGKAAAKAYGKAVLAALRAAASSWLESRADVTRGRLAAEALAPHTARYRRLIEAAGKLEVGAGEVIVAVTLGGDDALARSLRLSALAAVAGGFTRQAGVEALAAAVISNDARQRAFAAATLRALAPERAAELLPRVVADGSTLARLLGAESDTLRAALRSAATSVHTQGAALPYLVAAGDVEGIAAALRDRKLAEGARLGAVEALGRIGTPEALAALYAIASAVDEDEELRKAAYRAARRGRRYQAKRSEKREVAS